MYILKHFLILPGYFSSKNNYIIFVGGCEMFIVPIKNFSLIWKRHHCECMVTKLRPLLCAKEELSPQDLLALDNLCQYLICFLRLLQNKAGICPLTDTYLVMKIISKALPHHYQQPIFNTSFKCKRI